MPGGADRSRRSRPAAFGHAAPSARRCRSMHPGRVDVIGAGALVLRHHHGRCGFDAVVASEHDILDGIAFSLLG